MTDTLKLAGLWIAAWLTASVGLWGWLGWPAACLWTGVLLTAWAVLATMAGAAMDGGGRDDKATKRE